MSRLRIRIELNRGGVGVPLQKLASVVAESQKFFRMLGDDIHIDQSSGEWLGFDFDHESLNFTAEFVGPVTSEQVMAFNAAFDGTTSLRRATIAQFAQITDSIEEDELIGFGLYLNESGTEPGEWRCLSRRDALRIADEIRMLIGANDELAPESHLPAVSDSAIGARLFSERRERALEPAKWTGMVQEVEANLSRRIRKLETDVGDHTVHIDDLRAKSASSEASIGRLVSAVEGFCEQATRRLETIPAQALPAPATAAPQPPVYATVLPTPAPFNWRSAPVVSLAIGVALLSLSLLLWPNHSAEARKTVSAAPVEQVPMKPTPLTPPVERASSPAVAVQPVTNVAEKPAPSNSDVFAAAKVVPQKPSAPPPARAGASHIDLEAHEPTWISITEEGGNTLMSRMLQPNDVRSLELSRNAVLRAGNAGGLSIRFNGQPIGAIGPHGGVRDVEFKGGTYRIVGPVK